MAKELKMSNMKTPFKMKGYSYPGKSPIEQNNDGDTKGYHTVKDTSNVLTATGRGIDVTKEYREKGSKSTRAAIESGSKIYKHPVSGKITIQSS